MKDLQEEPIYLTPLQQTLFDFLFRRYNKLILNRKETAFILNMSVSKLDGLKEKGLGPKFSKIDTPGGKGSVEYALHNIVIYSTERDIMTASSE